MRPTASLPLPNRDRVAVGRIRDVLVIRGFRLGCVIAFGGTCGPSHREQPGSLDYGEAGLSVLATT
jgi:hypothetical protein